MTTEPTTDHRPPATALQRAGEIGAALVFIALAILLSRGLTEPFDESVARWVQSLSSAAMDLVMRGITHCGDTLTLTLVSAASSVLLHLLLRRWRAVALIWLAYGFGYGVNNAVKYLFARPRPQLSSLLGDPSSYSFPSGHAMVSTVIYGCIVFLLARAYPAQRWPLRIAAILFVFLIGLSRVYLDVHWPTDVLAGFSIGSLVLSALIRWYDWPARS